MDRIENDPTLAKYDFSSQIKEMDFSSFNPILNIGGLSMVILFVIL